ncbi:hypothetical protein BKA69DRAFT_1079378, partial [Paraphysoderma sedebokerense]
MRVSSASLLVIAVALTVINLSSSLPVPNPKPNPSPILGVVLGSAAVGAVTAGLTYAGKKALKTHEDKQWQKEQERLQQNLQKSKQREEPVKLTSSRLADHARDVREKENTRAAQLSRNVDVDSPGEAFTDTRSIDSSSGLLEDSADPPRQAAPRSSDNERSEQDEWDSGLEL